ALTAEGRNRRLNSALDGRLVGLSLKAVVSGAVVFDGESISRHGELLNGGHHQVRALRETHLQDAAYSGGRAFWNVRRGWAKSPSDRYPRLPNSRNAPKAKPNASTDTTECV